MLAGVDREHREAHREAGVDVGRRLQVVGVGAGAVAPALREHPPRRVVHDLYGRAAGAGHLADRLLREDRGDRGEPAHRAHRAHVAGCGEAEAIAQAGRGARPERARAEPLEVAPQRNRVLRRGGPDEDGAGRRARRLAFEVVQDPGGSSRRGDGKPGAGFLASERPLGPGALDTRGGHEIQVQLVESCAHAVPPSRSRRPRRRPSLGGVRPRRQEVVRPASWEPPLVASSPKKAADDSIPDPARARAE